MNSHFLLYIFLQNFLYLQIFSKTAILKFNELYNDDTDKSNLQNKNLFSIDEDIIHFEELYENLLYTIINIGTPEQSMMCIFNPDTNLFYVNNQDKCKVKPQYNYSLLISNSSKIIREISDDEEDDYYTSYYYVSDTIKIYMLQNNSKQLEEINDFRFRYEESRNSWGQQDTKEKIFCAGLGIQINQENKVWARFIQQLKDKDLINSYTITLDYSNNHGGYYYIGEYPHEYAPDIFNISQLISTYAIPKKSFSQFRIIMENIYIQVDKTDEIKICSKEVYFHLESGIIECSTDYYNIIKTLFFNQYLNNSICQMKTMSRNLNYYNLIVCKDSNEFDIKSFPSLHFYHSELNYHFNLNYKDLFEKKNNKYYFLIVYSSFSGGYWKLGKPFLKKYQITLNLDAKSINFYNNTKENEDEDIDNNYYFNNEKQKNIILIIICVILALILFIVSFLFIKKIKGERKKRANELKDEEYEYYPDNEENNKNEKLVKEKNNNTNEIPSIN